MWKRVRVDHRLLGQAGLISIIEKLAKNLTIANRTLASQELEKGMRAGELVVANKELAFQTIEKGKRAAELVIANKELAFQSVEKDKRAGELVIADKELAFQSVEKGKRAAELVVANKELAFQSAEKGKRADELAIADKELAFQKVEKGKRADELAIADKELAFQKVEKGKRADELAIATNELALQKELAVLQARLQQQQKMESLGVLAGGVAHDMNNVLGAILGLASAHKDLQPEGTPSQRAFDLIYKASTRGGLLVKSLLAFARETLPSEQELDLNTIIREEVEILARTTLAKVRLELELAPDLRPILGDVSALSHAFMNLCVNAVDAMPEQGLLTFRTHNVDNHWAEVVVEDNGTGMSEEVLAKATEPFFTTKGVGKGTGLGLSMVYTTVKAHRGQLAIESVPGRGTLVRLRFPACITHESLQKDAPARPVASGAGFSPPPIIQPRQH